MSMIVTPNRHGLGLVKSLPDQRDFKFRATRAALVQLPATFDHRYSVKQVFDQGNLGSCTGHGTVGALRILIGKERGKDYVGSRLAAYYLGRQLENTIDVDAGAQIRDVVKQMSKAGVVSEADWPYDVRRFREPPPPAAMNAAVAHSVDEYLAVPNDVTQMRAAIHARWQCVIGIAVYESFDSTTVAKTGKVPVPGLEEALLGWHCVYLVGWTKTAFYAVNSWGTGWGAGGLFTLPNAFIENPDLGGDFWSLTVS